MRKLLLSGTSEGSALAKELDSEVELISSLAGCQTCHCRAVRCASVGSATSTVYGLSCVTRQLTPSSTLFTRLRRPSQHKLPRCIANYPCPHLALVHLPWYPGDAVVMASDAEMS